MKRSPNRRLAPGLTAAIAACCLAAVGLSSCGDWRIGTGLSGGGRIIDHLSASVDNLSPAEIERAKDILDIVYWHTSHGSQIPSGMEGMDAFFGGTGLYAYGGADAPAGSLRFDDQGEADLGNPNGGPPWYERTRAWLNEHSAVNAVLWSWCGQVSGSTEADIADYLNQMSALEQEFPNVRFVYMTGHSDGSGLEGNLHQRNSQIRSFCETNGKFLYDFYDIECYDPDGAYYGDRHVDDGCRYDGGNWALEWQAAHPGEWWECGSAHSEPLNANRKAMAAWNLWVSLSKSL